LAVTREFAVRHPIDIRQLRIVLWSMAVAQMAIAAEVLPQPESPFQGTIGLSAKDSFADWPKPVTAPPGAPDIVLILVDDAGFAEPGSFGGLMDTPTFDRIAAEGLRYNRFHVTAVCSPTRAALLSGRNHHRVGFGSISEAPSGFPGYDTVWKKETASVAEILRRNGYSTAAFGKWHNTPVWEISPVGPFDRWPTGLGFEYFYGFMIGETSQWEPPLYRNTTAVDAPATADQGYNLTSDITNEAIGWLHTHRSLAPDKPYFLYFAPGATHAPHHVGKEWIDRYRGKFDAGWDALRLEIVARQKKLGIIPENTKLTRRPRAIPAWNSLSVDKRKLLSRQMEVYAGFMAQTDHEIGRLLQVVQQGPRADNTLILYIAGDNGASGMEGVDGTEDRLGPPALAHDTRLAYLDELGGPQHNNGYAAGWALMNDTPFQWMKLAASHFGGTRAPLALSWPSKIADHGAIRSQFTHVNAVAATLYEAAGITFPTRVDGVEQVPLDAPSFVYTFDHPEAASRQHVQYFENWGNRAIYQDGWVAAALHFLPVNPDEALNTDISHDQWELYHVDDDFSEAHNLAARYPAKLHELQQLFEAQAHANDVYPIGATFGPSPTGSSPIESLTNKKSFVYYPTMPRLPAEIMPDFTQSHRIVVQMTVPERGTEGMLVSYGGRFGGFALYVKENHLVYENNYRGKTLDRIIDAQPMPRGDVEVTYDFTREASTAAARNDASGGVGRLFVNDRLAAEMKLPHVGDPHSGAYCTFNVGEVRVSPVSDNYPLPFKFTATLDKVTVEMK
jgi:arylsulfatase A-like enzyme